MQLHNLHIENFRKLHNVNIQFGQTTFLIGANNAGKTSTLDALELLLKLDKKLTISDRSRYKNDLGEEISEDGDVVIEGEFRDVSDDVLNTRGFNRERLFIYISDDGDKKYGFKYRLRLDEANKVHREMQLKRVVLKPQYVACKNLQEIINLGVDAALFEGEDLNKKITAKDQSAWEEKYPELYDVLNDSEWLENPGGIAQNVLSRLPKFLKIKADVLSGEMSEKSGTLFDLLNIIFEELRESSDHYKKAKAELEALQKEMNPNDSDSLFGQLMCDLNKAVDTVFPMSAINVSTDLSKPESLKPSYGIQISSNVTTSVDLQGTGLVRSAVFALLRFNQQRQLKQESHLGMIVGFEEPELFLHPNASENMRQLIYQLSSSNCQIAATTHSPYMIDLAQDSLQVLNSYSVINHHYSSIVAFNLTGGFKSIAEDDKQRVKMVQKIDDYVSRVFFARKSVIVEGDTEDIVFKKTISLMPESVRKQIQSDYQIVMARGKATMISFVRYLKALNVDVFVVHDEDSGVSGAEKMNQPILDSLDGDANKRLMMHNCIEEELGYNAPSYDKPYKAYEFVSQWEKWDDVPERWKEVMKKVFHEFAEQL